METPDLQKTSYSAEQPCYPELIAILLAGALHVITELATSYAVAQIYNGVAVVAFGLYLWWRATQAKGALHVWGMRSDNFWPALRAQLLFGIPAALLLSAYGFWTGGLPLPRTFWLILCLYPLWGIAQQFAVQNLIARNLRSLLPRPMVHAVVTAVLFSVSHFPNLRLVGLVLIAGFGLTWIYRRHPNLWAVGIVHGVLGALSYYFVLHQDPGAIIMEFLN